MATERKIEAGESFADYLAAVIRALVTEREWRVGQAHFNVLRATRPDLAERIRATAVDPFYSDEIVSEFLDYVESLWDGAE